MTIVTMYTSITVIPALMTIQEYEYPSENCSEDADNVHEKARHYVLMLLTPLILLSNMAVLILLLHHRHSSRPDLLLIVSLCCADVTVGLSGIATLVTRARDSTLNGCLVRVGLNVTAVQTSIFSLLAVACDRLLAIVKALRYSHLVTTRRTLIVIFLFWMAAVSFGLLPLFGWNRGEDLYTGYCTFLLVFPVSFVAAVFVTTVLPITAILFIHAYIYVHARGHIRRINATDSVQGQRSSGPLGLSGRSCKTVRTVSLVTGCVLACWCPFLLTSLYVLLASHPPCFLNEVVGTHLLMMGYGNSALNPVVYALRNRELRAIAVKIWNKLRKRHM